MSLYDIALSSGTDKSHHGYCPHYEQMLSQYIDRECVLVEMGINSGASLKMWKEWLPKATVIGFDCEQEPCDKAKELGFEAVLGNQGRTYDLQKLANGRIFDIIIDDAGHDKNDQLTAFRFLFNHLAPGGWYVIEDLDSETQDNSVPLEITRPLSILSIIQGESKIKELHLFGDKRGDCILFLRKR